MGMSCQSASILPGLCFILNLAFLPPILSYAPFDINIYSNRPNDRSFIVAPDTFSSQSFSHDATIKISGRPITHIQASNSMKEETPFVSVSITTFLPEVTPSTARRAWLEYTWGRGGGLPVIVLPIGGDVNGRDGDGDGSSDPSEEKWSYSQKRRLLPLFAEEEIVQTDENPTTTTDDDDNEVVRYRLTRLGPVWQSEFVPDSHLASVSFSSATNGTTGTDVTWNVNYETIQNQNLWQTVTEQFVTDASRNLASYLAPPVQLTVTARIPAAPSCAFAAERWLEYVWWEGGGLPLPPPSPIRLDEDGIKRMIIPPFLVEKLCSVSISPSQDDTGNDGLRGDIERLKEAVANGGKGTAEVCYTVDNPGLLTYPVHTHFGEVRWSEDRGDVDMVWKVNVRPINGFGPYVRFFTETVITVLARNLKVHMEIQSTGNTPGEVDGSGMVGIYPPRGKNIGRFGKGGDPLFQVRKDTWVGRVLDAHLTDTRGAWEQSLDLVRPWRWGIVDGEDDIVVEWTDSSSSASSQ